jgi:hypothetical protein
MLLRSAAVLPVLCASQLLLPSFCRTLRSAVVPAVPGLTLVDHLDMSMQQPSQDGCSNETPTTGEELYKPAGTRRPLNADKNVNVTSFVRKARGLSGKQLAALLNRKCDGLAKAMTLVDPIRQQLAQCHAYPIKDMLQELPYCLFRLRCSQ